MIQKLIIKQDILFARVFFTSFRADIAIDITTPVKFAIALCCTHILMRIVASSAAHNFTTVGS